MARPPPPRRGVGAKASRAQGRRQARRQCGAAQGGRSAREPAAAPTPGSARAPVTGARVPRRKRRLCPGDRRSPWSPPPARLRSLRPPPPSPPPGVKQGCRSEPRGDSCGNSRGQGSSAAPSAPIYRGLRTPRPPRAALRAPVRLRAETVAAGEGRKARQDEARPGQARRGGGGASAGWWLRFRRARVLVLQPKRGMAVSGQNASEWKNAKTPFLPVYGSCYFPHEDLKYHLRGRGSNYLTSSARLHPGQEMPEGSTVIAESPQ